VRLETELPVDDDGTSGRDDDRVAIELGDFGERFCEAPDPQQQLLERVDVDPRRVPVAEQQW
jgi:hypothetical protein